MPHADQLLLSGRDSELDAATELFLRDHLETCQDCRDLQRKVSRADALIASGERALVVPDRMVVRPPGPPSRLAIASITAIVVVVSVVAGTSLRALRTDDRTSEVGGPGGPAAPALPKDWQLVIEQDLLIPLPPGWWKDVDTVASGGGEPASAHVLQFADRSADRGAQRMLAIWIWPTPTMERLVRERFIQGNLSFVSDGTFASWRPVREVVGTARWSDAAAVGYYRARSLFVQIDPERVAQVTSYGPRVPSAATDPTPEMRSIQELVVGHVVALADAAPTLTADQARAAIERRLPLEKIEVPIASPFLQPVTWKIRGRTDSTVRIDAYPFGTRPRATLEPSLLRGDSPPGSPSTMRVIGNLVVWVASPDANVRYTVLTGLDALLGPSQPPQALTSFEIKAVPPWHTEGTGRATLTSTGDLVLEISVHGPEVTRVDPTPRYNFIWHLLEGTCSAWQRNEPGHKVITRWELPAQKLDSQDFRYQIKKSDLDPMTQPHAVAAVRSGGGGPMYACGDLPAFGAPERAPSASSGPGFVNGVCTGGPLTESARSGEYVFRWTDIDEGNEFLIVEKRGAAIGDRLFATFSRLDAPGQIGYPEVIAQPFGSGPPVFRIGMYKPAGIGCWRVDLRSASDSQVVASYVVRIRETENGCPRTRTTDASGVITSNGLIGMVGTTQGTASNALTDAGTFGWLVRNGAKLGESVAVTFQQIGRGHAPASSVSYGIPAVPRQTAWGDIAFDMHYKPIGFADSCWRLFVNGVDSGIVLFLTQ